MGERVRPFAEGSVFIDWKRRNCDRCTLRWREGRGRDAYLCDIESALDYAYMDNGTVTETVAGLMRFDGEHVAEDCPARVEANVDSAE